MNQDINSENTKPYFDAGFSAFRPENPPNNTIYLSIDLDKKERFLNGEWVDISEPKDKDSE
jgi:hypothetical protein